MVEIKQTGCNNPQCRLELEKELQARVTRGALVTAISIILIAAGIIITLLASANGTIAQKNDQIAFKNEQLTMQANSIALTNKEINTNQEVRITANEKAIDELKHQINQGFDKVIKEIKEIKK